MAEVAINTPFEASEIKDIVCAELRKRLDALGPLQLAKEYASFDIKFNVDINLRRVGEVIAPKTTLAWGSAKGSRYNPETHDEGESQIDAIVDSYTSGDPNEEREERNMPLTVESKDGRGNITRKKVHIKS